MTKALWRNLGSNWFCWIDLCTWKSCEIPNSCFKIGSCCNVVAKLNFCMMPQISCRFQFTPCMCLYDEIQNWPWIFWNRAILHTYYHVTNLTTTIQLMKHTHHKTIWWYIYVRGMTSKNQIPVFSLCWFVQLEIW